MATTTPLPAQLVTTPAALQRAAADLAAGDGRFAIDTERASSFRYRTAPYLIQVTRNGAENYLVDPLALDDELDALAAVINDQPWILHGADQDILSLAEVGLRPATVHDTAHAGRLAGYTAVNLKALSADILDITVSKSHQVENWSTRPLPASWLRYAAQDTAHLTALDDALCAELAAADRLDWFEQDCAFFTHRDATRSPATWQQTKGVRDLRGPHQRAQLAACWQLREDTARATDLAPHRVIKDKDLVSLILERPRNLTALVQLLGRLRGRRAVALPQRFPRDLFAALQHAPAHPPGGDLPRHRSPWPQVRTWAETAPVADHARGLLEEMLAETAAELDLAAPLLLTAKSITALAWAVHSEEISSLETVAQAAATLDIRPWQRDLLLVPWWQQLEAEL